MEDIFNGSKKLGFGLMRLHFLIRMKLLALTLN